MIGKTIAHYRITALLGKGGMGEVYRATDTKLGREVAIKVLPHELADDPERIARFHREARTLATLQHPNVASVYGFEDVGEVRFLVMELVEGPDLAQRLLSGPIDVDDALTIAAQMARGLEAAHEQGIVHRDLKPANVKVTPDGAVKILDFGLARAVQGETQSETDLALSPTITAGMTQAGVVLGTAAYMSPEQARGKAVDKRADIWAFGVILYEMLTGARLFAGETVSDTFASVLREEIDFEALPVDTPAALQQVVRRCLVRDPRARLRDVGEARVILEGGEASGWMPAATSEMAPAADRRSPWPWIAAVAVALALGLGVGWSAHTPASPWYHLEIMPPPDQVFFERGVHQSLSPDGTRIAFVAQDSLGRTALWVRRLDEPVAIRLDGTEDATRPFWSPDSNHLGYFTSGELRRIPAAGGPSSPLAPVSLARGGYWREDGTIFFAGSVREPLRRVSARGGEAEWATVPDTSTSYLSERFPSSRGGSDDPPVFVRWQRDNSGVFAFVEGELVRLAPSGSRPSIAGNHLFVVQDGNLVLRELDGNFRPNDESVTLIDQVVESYSTGDAGFSVSPAGPLSYMRSTTAEDAQLRIYRRDGTSRGTSIRELDFDDIRITPDGRSVAIAASPGRNARSSRQNEGMNVWSYDVRRDVATRLTFDGTSDDPAWSRDGSWIAFATRGDIARARPSGVGAPEMLYEDARDKIVTDWSPDGRWILFVTSDDGGSDDIWALDLASDPPSASPLIATPFREFHPNLSPDGRWLSYTSNESGTYQVYLVDFPAMTRKIQVTREASSMPRWSREGRELLVLDDDRMLQSISLRFDGEDDVEIGEPIDLFRTQLDQDTRTHQFDVSADGELITILQVPLDTLTPEPIHIVTDWRRWVQARIR